MREKSQYPYIYVDPANRVHILFPYAEGSDGISRDNTCRSTYAAREFIRSILGVIQGYIDDLQADIAELRRQPRQNQAHIKKRQERLVQLQNYEKAVNKVVRGESEFRGVVMDSPALPPVLQTFLADPTQNVAGVLLDPQEKDNSGGFDAKAALTAVDRDSKAQSLGESLRGTFRKTDLSKRTIADAKTEVIKKSLQVWRAEHKQDMLTKDDELDRLKDVIAQSLADVGGCVGLKKEEMRKNLNTNVTPEGTKGQWTVNIAYINRAYAAKESAPLAVEDAVSAIVEGTLAPGVFNQIDAAGGKALSPFKAEVKSGAKSSVEDHFSICVQFLLFVINSHCITEHVRPNFTRILETNLPLKEEFLRAIQMEFESDGDIENAIALFIDQNADAFQLSARLSSAKIALIKKDFFQKYRTIKGSDHFDQFIALLPGKFRDFWHHQGRICCHFGLLFEGLFPEKYAIYFGGVRPLLARHIASPDKNAAFAQLPVENVVVRDKPKIRDNADIEDISIGEGSRNSESKGNDGAARRSVAPYRYRFVSEHHKGSLLQRMKKIAIQHPWRMVLGLLLGAFIFFLLCTPPGQGILIPMLAGLGFNIAAGTIAPLVELGIWQMGVMAVSITALGPFLIKGIGEILQFVGKWVLEIPSRLLLFPSSWDSDRYWGRRNMQYSFWRAVASIPGIVINSLGRLINWIGERIAGSEPSPLFDYTGGRFEEHVEVMKTENGVSDVVVVVPSARSEPHAFGWMDDVSAWKEGVKMEMSTQRSYYFS